MASFKSDPHFIVDIGGMRINSLNNPKVRDFDFEESDDQGKYLKFQVEDFEMKMMDDPRVVEGRKVTWRYGYENNYSPLFSGKIGEVEPTFSRDEGIYLTIHVFDAVMEVLGQTSDVVYKKPAPGMRASEVVELIAARNGLGAIVEPTKVLRPQWTQGGLSDWDYIQKLSERAVPLAGGKGGKYTLSFNASNTKLIWKPVPMGGPIKKTYLFYTENINPELIRFQPKSKPHDPTNSAMNGTTNAEPGENDDVEENTRNNETQTDRPTAGEGSVVYNATTGTGEVRKSGAVTTDPIVDDHAVNSQEASDASAGNLHDAAELEAMEADLEVIMEPKLRRGDTVQMRGFGKKFSGKYMIKTLRVIIDKSGGRNECLLKRNAAEDIALSAGGPATGRPGDAPAEESEPIQDATVDATAGTGTP